MKRAACAALAAVVLAPASAGVSRTRPPLSLTATPAHVAFAGSGERTIRVVNTGERPVVVDVTRAGFALDLRGRPKVVQRGAARPAAPWLAVRPRRLMVPVGASRRVVVAARLPTRIEPGDHDALVLLTTRPRPGAGVAVRMRIGVVVVVRAPGRVVRRLSVEGLRVRRARGARVLEILFANLGNVTETLERGRVRITLRRGREETRLQARRRDLRPRTRGVLEVRYRGPLAGWVTARVDVLTEPGGQPVRRTFRVKV